VSLAIQNVGDYADEPVGLDRAISVVGVAHVLL
jgi:hypothetical protein